MFVFDVCVKFVIEYGDKIKEAINIIQIVLRFFDYEVYVSHRPYCFYFIEYFPLDQRHQTNEGVNELISHLCEVCWIE